MARVPLPASGRYAFADMLFPAKARFALRLLAQVPKEARGKTFRVAARQMYGKEELGRVTWLLAPDIGPRGKRLA